MYRLNNKILKIIPLVFLVIILLKIVYAYFETRDRVYEFAKKEAEVLNGHFVENRFYYQNLFTDGTIELNERTLRALPAFSSHVVSNNFSRNNPLGISLKTVSDRARNPQNQADKDELKAIRYFKANPDKTEYFTGENRDFYQYATPLKIKESCLNCHGKREDAPLFIQKSYTNAYDYKIGETRGIVSIQIPVQNLNSYFFSSFFKSILFDLAILLTLFIGVYNLIKNSRRSNEILEEKIKLKTDELKDSFLKDRLTGLPNRLKLIEDIEQIKNPLGYNLVLINIDAFKDINDLYGYKAGDEILTQVSQKLDAFCEQRKSIYKLPNDEFALFIVSEIPQEEFLKIIKELLYKINKVQFNASGHPIFISFSCGIASNEESLLIKANAALQMAKTHSKSVVVYSGQLDTKDKIVKNSNTLALLKDAIEKDSMVPYFQPIYNVTTKKIEKYEALARIITANGGVVAPFAFLDVAIKSKLYPEITRAIIKKSFEFFEYKEFEFSINISILDIQNHETTKFILSKLKEFEAPHRVVFEILETDKIENYAEVKKFIKEIKKFGCKFAIDDFGSGYSNFSHILELNIDYLKIDASLVKFVSSDENSRIIVKSIINFASNLGLKTIAEFVEDENSLELLKNMGVDFVQGYHIGKPSAELISFS